MSIASSASQPSTISTPYVTAGLLSVIRQRFADYLILCRPRIAVMTMVSVAVGFTLASPVVFFDGMLLLAAVTGIISLVAASSILNQCFERHTDAQMTRTAGRPIAAGRVSVFEAMAAASLLSCFGFTVLWNLVNPVTASVTMLTLIVYVFGYTPLKTRTSLCTTIGAVPGAMPPVLGWLAAGGTFTVEPLALFAVFFIWQFPHFLAIGWIHRNDYRVAGLRMLPSFADEGLLTGLFAVTYAAAFVPVAALPAYAGLSGNLYLASSVLLSLCYLAAAVAFAIKRTEKHARRLLYVSLVCLPALLAALVVDFLRLTSMS